MRKLLCLLGIVLAAGAFAQNFVDITIGGKFIMRLRAGHGNLTVQERARIVEERLIEALGERLSEDQITLKEVRKDAQYEIYVRGRLLITVTQADADAAKMSVKQIAEHWLKQLRRTLPEVSARRSNNDGRLNRIANDGNNTHRRAQRCRPYIRTNYS